MGESDTHTAKTPSSKWPNLLHHQQDLFIPPTHMYLTDGQTQELHPGTANSSLNLNSL